MTQPAGTADIELLCPVRPVLAPYASGWPCRYDGIQVNHRLLARYSADGVVAVWQIAPDPAISFLSIDAVGLFALLSRSAARTR